MKKILNALYQTLTVKIPGVEDKFIPFQFTGIEKLSWGFVYRLHCWVDASLKIDDRLLHKTGIITIEMERNDDRLTRQFEGVIDRIKVLPLANHDRQRRVVLTFTSRFQQLALCEAKRTFLEKSCDEIIKEILAEYDIKSVWMLKHTYPPIPMEVQFDENHYDFINRLLSEWGIFYFFRFNSEGKQECVFSDHAESYTKTGKSIISSEFGGEANHHSIRWDQANHLEYKPAFYHYSQEEVGEVIYDEMGKPPYPWLDYKGSYCESDVTRRFGALSWGRLHQNTCTLKTKTTTLDVRPSSVWETKFSWGEAPHLVEQVCHRITIPPILDAAPRVQTGLYWNRVTFKRPCRYYPSLIKMPPMKGIHVAQVVSESTAEIDTNQYGWVKLHFPWDQAHHPSEPSTGYVPVMQRWAGSKYGALFIPRPGTEVSVNFYEGDLRRPLVQTCLYNGKDDKDWFISHGQLSGFQTPSGNAFLFDDTKGNEKVMVNADKDYRLYTKGDMKEWVGGNQWIRVGENSYRVIVDGDENITIENGNYDALCKEGAIEIDASEGIHFYVEKGAGLYIDKETLRLTGESIRIIGGGGGGLAMAARLGDRHQCPADELEKPHEGGAITEGSSNVFINGIPAGRLGDAAACEVGGPDVLIPPATGVFINGKLAARLGDPTEHGGNIVAGSGNVVIGGRQVSPSPDISAFDNMENLLNRMHPSKASPFFQFKETYHHCLLTQNVSRDIKSRYPDKLNATLEETVRPSMMKRIVSHYYSEPDDETYVVQMLLSDESTHELIKPKGISNTTLEDQKEAFKDWE